ncbi:hypothetical protein HDF16_005831 [Granulicella aggregans]|uniref:Uncharacterized protein n=1 Tax=Granulicella aggregans TaxID=474949 RepID=A0A7W7ZJI3_9BACT|nr:hypothetical protein [Granulicella aggregans]
MNREYICGSIDKFDEYYRFSDREYPSEMSVSGVTARTGLLIHAVA